MNNPIRRQTPGHGSVVKFMLLFCLLYPLALVVPTLLVQKFYYESICKQHAGAARLTFIGYSGSSRLAPARCRYQGGNEIALKTLGGWPVTVSQIVLAIYTPIGCFFVVMAVLLVGRRNRPPGINSEQK